MRRLLFCAFCMCLVACSKPTPPTAMPDPSTAPPKTVSAQASGRAIFCAYGGVGVVPDPLPPGYETVFTSVTIDLDQPGKSSAIEVKNIELIDAAGKVAASMRRVTEIVQVDATKTPPGRTESGSWAFFLNPTGDKFDGTLPKGRTRLRIRASLNASPAEFPARVRVTIGGLATPLVVEGEVWGAWPT